MRLRTRVGLRAVAALALAGGAAALATATRPPELPAPRPADARHAATPLWSPRRAPYVFTGAVARARLHDAVAAAAASPAACLAVTDPASGPLARVRADLPLAPASATKLFTAAAALHVLGPDHTLTTRVLAAGDTLHLVGGGDPALATPEHETRLRASPRYAADVVTPLAALADAVAGAGVGPVARLQADDSRHDAVRFLPGWKPSYRDDVGALSALTVDDGFAGATRVDDPALLAAERLASLLRARGVAVGTVERGAAPPDAREVASVASAPLHELVAAMLTASDNLTAELLVREVGLARGGDGSTAAGTEAVVAALRGLGVPTRGLDLRDGSGLDPANRATCDAVLATLGLRGARFAALDRGLAVAGRTGTLATRLVGDPLASVLRAKTGQIEGVAALAGVVDDAEALRFAFVVNGDFTTAAGQDLQVGAARAVAAYPDAPPAEDLVPPP